MTFIWWININVINQYTVYGYIYLYMFTLLGRGSGPWSQTLRRTPLVWPLTTMESSGCPLMTSPRISRSWRSVIWDLTPWRRMSWMERRDGRGTQRMGSGSPGSTLGAAETTLVSHRNRCLFCGRFHNQSQHCWKSLLFFARKKFITVNVSLSVKFSWSTLQAKDQENWYGLQSVLYMQKVLLIISKSTQVLSSFSTLAHSQWDLSSQANDSMAWKDATRLWNWILSKDLKDDNREVCRTKSEA